MAVNPGKTALLVLTVVLLGRTPAFGWGAEGHKAIGELARQQLSAAARKGVIKVLGNDDLAAVATWPDEVKQAAAGQGPLAHDPEAQKFNSRFPDNKDWHFVNLPLKSPGYTPSAFGAQPHDIVHLINRCITVLETPSGQKTDLTRKQAVRFLVHLVGDIHQPLHVADGYYRFDAHDNATLVEDPAQAKGLQDDRGGNDLFFGPGDHDELHGYWDFDLVEKTAGGPEFHQLVAKLQKIPRAADWATGGDYHKDWAKSWANDSLAAAEGAYHVKFARAHFDGQGHLRIDITMLPSKDGYLQEHVKVAAGHLAKGAGHLADLLNRIRWP
jgi:hypothetical protein